MIVGITGIAGSGKTTVKKILEKYGYDVFDVDDFVKEIYKKHNYKKIRENIAKIFPECAKFTRKRTFIDKNCIKNIIFNDHSKKKELENLIHPIVKKKIERIIRKYIKRNKSVFIVVPLLYEANLEYLFDEIWLIYTPIEIAVNRLIKRDKISQDFALKIINSQEPQNIKVKKANKIIINDSDIQELEKQIKKIIDII